MNKDEAPEAERLAPAPPQAKGTGRGRRLLRLAAVDLGPLRRHRDYRLLFVGQGLSFFGSMVTYVALPYQAYALTRSSLVVGFLTSRSFCLCSSPPSSAGLSPTPSTGAGSCR